MALKKELPRIAREEFQHSSLTCFLGAVNLVALPREETGNITTIFRFTTIIIKQLHTKL
jgi:hypothetical protein